MKLIKLNQLVLSWLTYRTVYLGTVIILLFIAFASDQVLAAESSTDVQLDHNAASNSNLSKYTLKNIPTLVSLSYESIDRPDGAENLGLAGLNVDFQLYQYLYGGFSLYGAADGDLGGLFVFGVNAGIQQRLYRHLWLDSGIFAGGGGARHDSTDDSDGPSGFMDRAQLGLAYDIAQQFHLGVYYSHVDYADYDIHRQQFGLSFTFPGKFLLGDPAYRGAHLTDLDEQVSPINLGFFKSFLGLFQETYFPVSSTNLDNESSNQDMQLVGIKYALLLSRHVYLGASAAGAYSSGQNGYMDVFLLPGYLAHINQELSGYVELGLGLGGGGNVDTGGGFIYKPSVGLGYHLTPALELRGDAGYLQAPSGDFQAYFAELGVYYNFLNAQSCLFCDSIQGDEQYHFGAWRMGIANQTYNHPQRSAANTDEETIQLVSLSLDKILDKHWFIRGQANSAYAGNAGAYATGMLGIGLNSLPYHQVQLTGDVLIGAAGGADMSVGDGAIYQPEIGLSYQVSKHSSIIALLGRVIAFDGDLDSTTVTIGWQYSFSSLQEGV